MCIHVVKPEINEADSEYLYAPTPECVPECVCIVYSIGKYIFGVESMIYVGHQKVM
jgi:hypothetical protein